MIPCAWANLCIFVSIQDTRTCMDILIAPRLVLFYTLLILTKLSRPRLPWLLPVYFDISLVALSRYLLHKVRFAVLSG